MPRWWHLTSWKRRDVGPGDGSGVAWSCGRVTSCPGLPGTGGSPGIRHLLHQNRESVRWGQDELVIASRMRKPELAKQAPWRGAQGVKSMRSAVGDSQYFVHLSRQGSTRPVEPWVLLWLVSQQWCPSARARALFPTHQVLVVALISSELVERRQVNGGHIPGPSGERLPVYSQEKESG